MQVATRADGGGARGKRMGPAFAAAAALATCLAAESALATPQQLAHRMSPAQDMNKSSGPAQAERISPMSGTSRAGLTDEMGRSGSAQRPGNEARTLVSSSSAPASRRDMRDAPTSSSPSRAGRSGDVNAISEYNRSEGAVLVSGRSGIREIAQLRGQTICFPNPADQAEAYGFLGGRSVSFIALTADGPPSFLVNAFNRGECQAIYMSRTTQQMMANMAIPDAIVLTR